MNNKTIANLKLGQRFIYTDGRCVKLLLEITGKVTQYRYPYRQVVPVRVLAVMKDKYTDYYIGESLRKLINNGEGTWRYLEGQDAPKKSRSKK